MPNNLEVGIRIKADASGARRGIGDLQKSLDSLRGSLKRISHYTLGGILGFQAVSSLRDMTRALVDTAAEFESLGATLETITGSAARAQLEFGRLRAFASSTPYDLQQVVSAFIKLKARGLDPSIAALRSYGNTAAAMGKSLDQFIEAVADAVVGEFERLKEFGIKARTQGDQIQFTFRGITTTVAREADAIEAYLRKIGETDFAGAMERRANTLEGALSNLGDAFSNLANRIAESGLGNIVKGLVQDITEAVNKLAGIPRTTEEIIRDLEAARRAGGSRRSRRGFRLGGRVSNRGARASNVSALEQELLNALVAQGGEAGIRIELTRAEDRLRELLARSTRARGRARLAINQQITRVRSEIEQLTKRLSDLLLESENDTSASARVAPQRASKAIEKQNEALKKQARRWLDLVNPMNRVAREMAELEKLRDRGLLNPDAYAEAIFRLGDLIDEGAATRIEQGVDRRVEAIKSRLSSVESLIDAKARSLQSKVIIGLTSEAAARVKLRKIIGQQGRALERELLPRIEHLLEITSDPEKVAVLEQYVNKIREMVAVGRQTNFLEGAKAALRDYAGATSDAFETAKQTVSEAMNEMENAIVRFVRTGKLSFRSLVDSILGNLARLATRRFVSSLLEPIFGGFLKSVHGNAFAGGQVLAFASGGAFANSVVTGPTLFPLGLMGEAGPEAILPLKRTRSGDLGVTAEGLSPKVEVHVHEEPGKGGQVEERADGNVRIIDVFVDQVRGALIQDVGRDGPFARALESQYGLNRAPGGFR